MSKSIFLMLFCFTLGGLLEGVEDKPALSAKERALLLGSQIATGALAGTAAAIAAQPSYRHEDPTPMIAVGAAGAGAGYMTTGYLGNLLMAWRHGVTYSIEKVTRYFNINIEQYRPLFLAAYEKDRQALRAMMLKIYEERFGPNWQKELKEFLTHYIGYAKYLAQKRPKTLKISEKELIRMVELGAALESIYFDTKYSRKTIVDEALAIYHFLGVI